MENRNVPFVSFCITFKYKSNLSEIYLNIEGNTLDEHIEDRIAKVRQVAILRFLGNCSSTILQLLKPTF